MIKLQFTYFVLLLLVTGCSSTNKYEYYKAESLERNKLPVVTQKTELVFLTYRTTPRSFFQNDNQQRAWIKVQNYSRKTYTFGPIFLPVIPYFDGSRPLDLSKDITIELTAFSDAIYPEKILNLPNLSIETSAGRILKPRTIDEGIEGINFKKFVYDATVKENPWFVIQEATIQLDGGKTLKIPRMRFYSTSEFIINWNESIAP